MTKDASIALQATRDDVAALQQTLAASSDAWHALQADMQAQLDELEARLAALEMPRISICTSRHAHQASVEPRQFSLTSDSSSSDESDAMVLLRRRHAPLHDARDGLFLPAQVPDEEKDAPRGRQRTRGPKPAFHHTCIPEAIAQAKMTDDDHASMIWVLDEVEKHATPSDKWPTSA